MDVMIDAGRLGRLLGPRPKVIVGRSDVGPGAGEGQIDGRGSAELWVFGPSREGGPAVLRPWGDPDDDFEGLTVLGQPPTSACVPAAASAEAARELSAMLDWWSAVGPAPPPPLLSVEAESGGAVGLLRSPEVLGTLLRATLLELETSCHRQAELGAQLYELRLEQQHARVALESLESRLARHRLCPQMTVSLSPDGRTYAPPPGLGELIQPLPARAEGLAGIDLHFPTAPVPSSDVARLRVRLEALDTGERLGDWLIGPAAMGQGWARCWLPRALSDVARDLELRVGWLTADRAGTAISMADVGDWPELEARLDGGPSLGASLALTAWTADPGASIEPGPHWGASITDSSVEFGILDPEVSRRLRGFVAPGRPEPDWPIVIPMEGGPFRLHPLGTDPAIAVLGGGCPPDVDQLSAVVRISHPECQGSVQFSMALVVPGDDPAHELIAAADRGGDRRILGFSGWRVVPPDQQPHALFLTPEGPTTEVATLIFATRVAPGEPLGFAWADWLDVRARMRGASVRVVRDERGVEERRDRAA